MKKKNGFANGASEPDIKSMNVPNDRLILPIGGEKDAFKALSQANDTPLKLEWTNNTNTISGNRKAVITCDSVLSLFVLIILDPFIQLII